MMHMLDVMNKSMTKSSIMKVSATAAKAAGKRILRTARGKVRRAMRSAKRVAKPGYYKGRARAYQRAVERGSGTVMGPKSPIGRRLARLERARVLSERGAVGVRRARPRALVGIAATAGVGAGRVTGRRRRRKKRELSEGTEVKAKIRRVNSKINRALKAHRKWAEQYSPHPKRKKGLLELYREER